MTIFGNTTKNLHDCQVQTFCDLLTKMSKYFGGERNEETEKDKDQDDLRVEEAEGDGNTNP